MSELRRLRREHEKALRRWKGTRKPSAWKAMRDLTTAIVALSRGGSPSGSREKLGEARAQ